MNFNLKYSEVVALRCGNSENRELLMFLALAKMAGFQSRLPSQGWGEANKYSFGRAHLVLA
jgi:hypothetical protein